jgi:hypothetical protein
LAVSSSSESKERHERKDERRCWNCGEMGHLRSRCSKLRRDTPMVPCDAVNAAVSDSEEEYALFFVDKDRESLSGLAMSNIGDCEDRNSLLSGRKVEELSKIGWRECGSLVSVDSDSTVTGSEEGTLQIHGDGDELTSMAESVKQLHRRLGHISTVSIRELIEKGLVEGLELERSTLSEVLFCESCTYAKATRKAVPKAHEGERAKVFGRKVHMDLWGLAPVETRSGRNFFVMFTDDAMWLTHLFLLRLKEEVFGAYREYEAWCCTQLNVHIKILHSECGGEYMGMEFSKYLKAQGTEQQLTKNGMLAHSGVAKCHN